MCTHAHLSEPPHPWLSVKPNTQVVTAQNTRLYGVVQLVMPLANAMAATFHVGVVVPLGRA